MLIDRGPIKDSIKASLANSRRSLLLLVVLAPTKRARFARRSSSPRAVAYEIAERTLPPPTTPVHFEGEWETCLPAHSPLCGTPAPCLDFGAGAVAADISTAAAAAETTTLAAAVVPDTLAAATTAVAAPAATTIAAVPADAVIATAAAASTAAAVAITIDTATVAVPRHAAATPPFRPKRELAARHHVKTLYTI